jgi:hypothetical protein
VTGLALAWLSLVAWVKREPVRVRAYGVAVLVAGYLLVRGYIGPTDKEFVLSLLGLVLGVERTRSKVTPERVAVAERSDAWLRGYDQGTGHTGSGGFTGHLRR